MTSGLVDPTAPAATTSPVTRWDGSGRLALVDAMLDPDAGRGVGILDAVEEACRSVRFDVVVDRLRREHRVGAPGPEAWGAGMAATYRALVIAAGD